jgi:hypothetical protein
MTASTVAVTAEFADCDLAQAPMCMVDICDATGADPFLMHRLFNEHKAPQNGVGLAMLLTSGVAHTLRDALQLTRERMASGALIVTHSDAIDDAGSDLDQLFGPVKEVEVE